MTGYGSGDRVARRTPSEVYQALVSAGWAPAAAVIMTAIAGAESGWNDTALGDTGITDATWGPSFGLFQIRTIKGQTGSGGDRDLSALSGDIAAQARAALHIAHGGADFNPWTTYQSGKYKVFIPQAMQAAGGINPLGGLGAGDGQVPAVNPLDFDPDKIIAKLRGIGIETLALLAGAALLIGGVWLLAQQQRTDDS